MYAEIINYAIRSTACLAFFYMFYSIILRNETCFRFNRGFLLITLALSLVLPLLSFSVTLSNNSPIDPNAFILPEVIITDTILEQAGQSYNILSILNILYFLGTTYLIFRLSFRMYHLWKIINSNRHLRENKYTYKIIPTEGKLPTSSFLNYLFWDNTSIITEHEKHQMLSHERVHILEKHTYDLLLIEVLSVLFWFNPFIWLWKKEISENHEYLADAKASKGIDSYSNFLARHTLALNGFTIVHPFKSSEVIKRLQMLKKYGKRTKLVKFLAVIPLLTFMIFTMSFSVEDIIDQPIDTNFAPTNSRDNAFHEVKPAVIEKPKYTIDELSFTTDLEYTVIPHSLSPKEVSLLGEVVPMVIAEIKEEEVFFIVEETAQPKEGMPEFYQFITKNMKYPKQARKLGIEGRVFVEFIVDKYGNITEVKAVKGIGAGCDAEAVRVLSSAPVWNPGKQRGKAVKQKIVLPITFKLG